MCFSLIRVVHKDGGKTTVDAVDEADEARIVNDKRSLPETAKVEVYRQYSKQRRVETWVEEPAVTSRPTTEEVSEAELKRRMKP
jgi:hypothetical protein